MNDLLNAISRIKATQDGIDFVEYLNKLSIDNYNAFKKSSSAVSEVHKGYAIAIDSLIRVFATCDDVLKKEKEPIANNEKGFY